MKPLTAEEIAAIDARFNAGETVWMRCLHHEVLIEPLAKPLSNRICYILTQKPEHERERRLSELQLFKQPEKLPSKFVQAGTAFVQARTAFVQAGTAYDQAWTAFDQARTAFDQAGTAFVQAETAFDQARTALVQAETAYDQAGTAYSSEIASLDRENYPDSKWNGKTIFPEKGMR